MSADLRATETRKRHEQAKLDGGAARRAGRKIGDNPYHGNTALVLDLHYAWRRGWLDEDAARKVRR